MCLMGRSVTYTDRALLGSELRRIREGQALTGMEVAEALGWSQSKVPGWRLAGSGPRLGRSRACLITTGFMRSCAPSCSRGWWREPTGSTAPGPSAPEVRLAGKDRSRAVESRLTTLT